MRAGPWMRLCGLGATGAVVLVVASGELGLTHRALVVVALPLLVAMAVGSWWAHRAVLRPTSAALVLYLAALATWWAPRLHVALAGLAAAGTAVATAQLYRGRRPAPVAWRDYVALTKPRIMSLLLLTGAAGMFVGAQGLPVAGDFVAMMVGLALACGGASAMNHVLDRDVDRSMKRTSSRPVAEGRVSPELALEFGLALSALSFVLLASAVNVLTACLALVGNLFYVLVYTRWLKRSTPQNIVIGGAAGAVPPLVGYAAATGNLALPALFLFLIVFFWTPPHFWALALLIKRDYEAARIPMLPVVRGDRETARQVLLYTVLLVALTLVPVLTGTFGWLYLGAAALLGAQFIRLALGLRRATVPAQAGRLFHYSLAYLALLFVAMAIDPMVML
ncbi:MAG TPA: heme o synthase [Gaiellaceae bacterium]|nr:heme o synthase [Gaiellaceae bacterium]HET8653348.1 heme o synthase [Gaiellaceae bacterium]